MVDKLANPPIAFGANCGVGASDLLRTVLGFSAMGIERPIIAKGNAGIPKYEDGHIHYDGTPDLMADYAVLARDCGATIIGGCCGTHAPNTWRRCTRRSRPARAARARRWIRSRKSWAPSPPPPTAPARMPRPPAARVAAGG